MNTRRAQKILEGHSGNSVIWVRTLQTASALIRWRGHFVLKLLFWQLSYNGTGDFCGNQKKRMYNGQSGFVWCLCCWGQSGPGHARVFVGPEWRSQRRGGLCVDGQHGVLSVLHAGDEPWNPSAGLRWRAGGGENLRQRDHQTDADHRCQVHVFSILWEDISYWNENIYWRDSLFTAFIAIYASQCES